MAVHKLHIDEFDEIDYRLIAIHTQLEDYRLAYFINQNLPVILKKNNCNVHISDKKGEAQFTRFVFDDIKAGISWDLIQNQNEVITVSSANEGLFANSASSFSAKAYLIPEFRKVDYFLKIENAPEHFDIQEIMGKINNIAQVSTVYTVDVENIKSKNNLIF